MFETFEPIVLNPQFQGKFSFLPPSAGAISSADPYVELEPAEKDGKPDEATKVQRQLDALARGSATLADGEGGKRPPTWAHRCYAVTNAPAPFREHLYLFNVLVALEWRPDAKYLEQLKWGFQRASDFLFDITDGYMAFGQVVFGGLELMDAADIQIMASSRLHPRSWVGGIHENDTYMPIRLGRGLWSDRQRFAFPWEEPEAFRVLIHEWGHYALHLVDGYLKTQKVSLPQQIGRTSHRLFTYSEPTPRTIVIPSINLGIDSITANIEGTSELLLKQLKDLGNLYDKVRTSGRRDGPRRVPADLPQFLPNPLEEIISYDPPVVFPSLDSPEGKAILAELPASVTFDQCWLYVLRGLDRNNGCPTRIIAQGTLDSRSKDRPYAVLGAEINDTLVLIADTTNQRPRVLKGKIEAYRLDDQEVGAVTTWYDATPFQFPVVDVLPDSNRVDDRMASVRVRVQMAENAAPDRVCLFPLGQMSNPDALLEPRPYSSNWISAAQEVKTLDGHVFVSWGEQNEKLMIVPFSQGGGPPGHTPAPTNPVTAGSADGNAMLFFDAPPDTHKDYKNLKVVTTLVHGIPGAIPPGAQARGYAYSLASTGAIPLELNPTLVLYFNMFTPIADEREEGDLRICRLEDQQWKIMPTYLPPSYPFAALPFIPETAAQLVEPNIQQQARRAEYYQLFWIPR